MIKIKDYEQILKSAYNDDVLASATNTFKAGLERAGTFCQYLQPFGRMTLKDDTVSSYMKEGLNVLMPAISTKKKLDISDVTESYIYYTGLLNREFVLGYDTTKSFSTAIYTKSEKLLRMLASAGAFEDVAKYEKSMKALFGDATDKNGFGNKVLSCFEGNKDNIRSLAMARLDISGVVGDSVSLDLIIPSKFRDDVGTTFLLYPYTIFPYLTSALQNFINTKSATYFSEGGKKKEEARAIIVLQKEPDLVDGTRPLKVRRVAFLASEVKKAYNRGLYTGEQIDEVRELVDTKIRKTVCGWDCLKLYMKGYNLESSLYSTGYTTIRLERVVDILPCGLRDIDTSMYLVDYDSVRKLFMSRVRNWKLNEFVEFNTLVNTDSCANIEDRTNMVLAWANNLDDADLYKLMVMKNDLFKTNTKGVVKSLQDGLDDMYRQKPNSSKHLKFVELTNNLTDRKVELRDLLKSGVCRIEAVSTRTGAPRTYMATNNEEVLKGCYGKVELLGYESPRRAIEYLKDLIKKGKIGTYLLFRKNAQQAKVDGLIDFSVIDSNSDTSAWLAALETALVTLDEDKPKREEPVPNYLVNFRRINADTRTEFYGSVDVRNITSVEFGLQK